MKDKKSSLFIFLTDKCNLKCLGCMQSCDRINNEHYFITLTELTEALKIIKRNSCTVGNKPIAEINLTGGDPLTHPAFIKICELTHQFFPDVRIQVSTNGLFLNKFTDQQLIYLSENYNVGFQISLYAKKSLLEMYNKILERAEKLGIFIATDGGSHFFFTKQDLIEKNGANYPGYTESCKNLIYNQNHVILYKNNIYSCWKDINFSQQSFKTNDNLNINSIQMNQELIQNKEHNFCEYCKKCRGSGGEEFILWNHHQKNAEFIFQHTMEELFVDHYDIYHNLQHNLNIEEIKEILSNQLFQQYLSDNQKRFANTRFLKGKGDIFIPFSKELDTNLKNFLLSYPNIIDYNLYFVSVNNDSEIEKKAYQIFVPYYTPENLNSYLLKANNLVSGYKSFIDNSYLQNKFILDIDNYTIEPFNG